MERNRKNNKRGAFIRQLWRFIYFIIFFPFGKTALGELILAGKNFADDKKNFAGIQFGVQRKKIKFGGCLDTRLSYNPR